MADLPIASLPDLPDRLSSAMDLEGKLPRALESLGPVVGRRVGILDLPGTPWLERLRGSGVDLPQVTPAGGAPLAIPAPDGSLDAFVTLWTGFRGVGVADLAEADRALRPGGRLLVVHDYGRDDVSSLRDPEAPEYRAWSRREGPFLRDAGFRIRVIHAFWTFADLDAAREALACLGERGETLAAGLRRPRVSWNLAVYHRTNGGDALPNG